jgi:hypothetical protein
VISLLPSLNNGNYCCVVASLTIDNDDAAKVYFADANIDQFRANASEKVVAIVC